MIIHTTFWPQRKHDKESFLARIREDQGKFRSPSAHSTCQPTERSAHKSLMLVKIMKKQSKNIRK